MTHIITDILDPTHIIAMRDQLKSFAHGGQTAGWHAKLVKNNEQAEGAESEAVRKMVETTLLAHPVFKAAAQPKLMIKTLISRYKPGMSYGTHVDEPMMAGIRTDLSFTLFLSDPDSYDGGALVIDGSDGENEVKLPAGSLVLYPTTTRSFIRNAEDREILFDLENVIASLRSNNADRALLDHILKIRANLLRKWVED
jgi:PKHD-type hydroxylase